jgi:hypothetical protein
MGATLISELQHTCPPGPELLENVSSTSFLGIFVCGASNLASQSDASVLSSSVTSSVSGGGFGNADDGGGAVKMNRVRRGKPKIWRRFLRNDMSLHNE